MTGILETYTPDEERWFADERARMVREQIAGRGIRDPNVLRTLAATPRHLFVPRAEADQSYRDYPLPIGEEQTISQPYIVAYMLELLKLRPDDVALEIGTGSGYMTALLAGICRAVYSVEIVDSLGRRAEERLRTLGVHNAFVNIGDGYHGWAEHAPYDAIIGAAAPSRVPQPLIDQLAEGGRLVFPIGTHFQEVVLITRKGGKVKTRSKMPVRFVPMTGIAAKA